MVDRDVVTAKLSVIDRCLARIADVQGPRRPDLGPLDVEDITALNLQRAVQAAIDLATHVLASEGHGVPAETAEVFTLLREQGFVEPELAERLRRMVGFRSVALHEYPKLNPAIVQAIVERHLGDLRVLGSQVVQRFGLGGMERLPPLGHAQ